MNKTEKINLRKIEKMVLILIFLGAITVMTNGFKNGISGNDFWWHIKVGEWICQHRMIPSTDIFSWYGMQQNLDWVPHEWLAEVIFYFVYRFLGEIGIFLMSFGMALVLYCLIWRDIKKYIEKNVVVVGIILIIMANVMVIFFYGRPHIFSILFFYILLKVLYKYEKNQNTKCIYWIPLLALFWSNLHGGSSNLTYIMCILFLVSGMFSWSLGCITAERNIGRKKGLLLVTVLSFLAIGINPSGAKIWIYPYKSMADSFMLKVISEWSAPDVKNIATLFLFFLPVVLVYFVLIGRNKKIDFIDILILGFFTYMFLRSIRFIIFLDIAICCSVLKYIPICKIKPVRRKELILILGVCGVLAACIGSNILTMYTTCKNEKIISKVLSDEMIGVIKEQGPKRIFNDYNFGETLIANDIRVFVDSRADLFAENDILKEAICIEKLVIEDSIAKKVSSIEDLISKYKFDGFVTACNGSLYPYLSVQKEKYRLEYEDEVAAYFSVY